MGQVEHFDALRAKHADLEHQIAEETRRPQPSEEALVRLKREKLYLKDRMAGIEAHPSH